MYRMLIYKCSIHHSQCSRVMRSALYALGVRIWWVAYIVQQYRRQVAATRSYCLQALLHMGWSPSQCDTYVEGLRIINIVDKACDLLKVTKPFFWIEYREMIDRVLRSVDTPVILAQCSILMTCDWRPPSHKRSIYIYINRVYRIYFLCLFLESDEIRRATTVLSHPLGLNWPVDTAVIRYSASSFNWKCCYQGCDVALPLKFSSIRGFCVSDGIISLGVMKKEEETHICWYGTQI
jgi:hypothetical protein